MLSPHLLLYRVEVGSIIPFMGGESDALKVEVTNSPEVEFMLLCYSLHCHVN